MGEIQQASFTTNELEIYIDQEEEDLFLLEVYERNPYKLKSRLTFINYELAFNYVHEEVL